MWAKNFPCLLFLDSHFSALFCPPQKAVPFLKVFQKRNTSPFYCQPGRLQKYRKRDIRRFQAGRFPFFPLKKLTVFFFRQRQLFLKQTSRSRIFLPFLQDPLLYPATTLLKRCFFILQEVHTPSYTEKASFTLPGKTVMLLSL